MRTTFDTQVKTAPVYEEKTGQVLFSDLHF